MKKLILATVSAVALLGMAACSDSGKGTDTTTTQSTQPAAPADPQAAPADPGRGTMKPADPAAPARRPRSNREAAWVEKGRETGLFLIGASVALPASCGQASRLPPPQGQTAAFGR